MYNKLKKQFEKYDLNWRLSLHESLNTRAQYESAQKHAWWLDHEFLRKLYHNDYEIAPGVYRSNQPSPNRIDGWTSRGVKTIINLRGASNHGSYYLEVDSCQKNKIKLIDHALYATRLPTAAEILSLENIFKNIDGPFLLHCKSGADRAGLASALYHIFILKSPIEVAQKQLSIKYLHLKFSKSGILDFMLERYRITMLQEYISFRDWIQNVYDPTNLTIEYRKGAKK